MDRMESRGGSGYGSGRDGNRYGDDRGYGGDRDRFRGKTYSSKKNSSFHSYFFPKKL